MNNIDDVTLETLLERTGKNILVQTKKDGIEQGKLSNVKTSSISIISEIGEKTTIAFKKIGAICLLGQHPEILYQN